MAEDDRWIAEYQVLPPGNWDWHRTHTSWWGVTDKTGTIAYFEKEDDAINFRMLLISTRANRMKLAGMLGLDIGRIE